MNETADPHVVSVVRVTPRRDGEHYLDYIERLCVVAGLMEPAHAMRHDPRKTHVWSDPWAPAPETPPPAGWWTD